MLASIHPLGERARRSRWGVTVASFVAGSVAGGALIGFVAGAAGALGRSVLSAGGIGNGDDSRNAVALVVAIAVCVAAGAADAAHAAGRARRWPTPARQVNDEWLTTYRGWVYGGGFGFQLGLGVTTIVTTAAVYATLAIAFLVASPAGGAVIGAGFGLARAAPVLTAARIDTPSQLRDFHRAMQSRAPTASTVTVTALWILAAAAGAGLMAR